LQHGDFGLGTFENQDGEMVVLDGRVYRIQGNGTVSEAPADATAPFAVVTTFSPEVDLEITPAETLKDLHARCDAYRPSNNIFYAFRLDGRFHDVRTRAVSPPKGSHDRLVDIAQVQAEFEFHEIEGTLVSLWSPGFSNAFSIPGYHFHFLSADRRHVGHLLECSTGTLRLRREKLTDFHLALPENEMFLKADLSKNASDELAYAEEAHRKSSNPAKEKIMDVQPETQPKNGAEVVVQTLESRGVEYVFGIPGDKIDAVFNARYRGSDDPNCRRDSSGLEESA
jgi:acetolactate decarboxylase